MKVLTVKDLTALGMKAGKPQNVPTEFWNRMQAAFARQVDERFICLDDGIELLFVNKVRAKFLIATTEHQCELKISIDVKWNDVEGDVCLGEIVTGADNNESVNLSESMNHFINTKSWLEAVLLLDSWYKTS